MPRGKKTKASKFSICLRQLLDKRGMSVKEAAQVAGVAQSTVATWLSGAAPSDLEPAAVLADHFGVSLSYLLLLREDKRADQGTRSPSVDDVLASAGFLYQGLARISIEKLEPISDIEARIKTSRKKSSDK